MHAQLQRRYELSERAFKFDPRTDDIFVVSSVLKVSLLPGVDTMCSLPQSYLRELPEPVFRFSLQDRIQHSDDLGALRRPPPRAR
jgi:hypothetical protein